MIPARFIIFLLPLASTIGLMISLGGVVWNIDANFNYGRDWPRTAMKLSTGLLVKF